MDALGKESACAGGPVLAKGRQRTLSEPIKATISCCPLEALRVARDISSSRETP